MKIQIVAYLSAPGLLQWYGASNPIIFTGKFTKEVSAEEKACLKYRSTITCKGVRLVIRKIHKGKIFTCDGQLSSVSVHFFKKLKKAGWKIDKKASSRYGFPDDDQDKRLQDDILEYNERNQRYLRAQKQLKKTSKKAVKEMKKKLLPFKKFPQVH